MPYRIAGIAAHKKTLAVVAADVEVDGDFDFERQKFGTMPTELCRLADWLVEHEIEEVVMESTAQYWRPVWEALEQHWRPRRRARESAPRLAGTLHLAQAQSNRGRGGRKQDFPDAERLVKRLVAQELTLSFVPDAEQRLWRTVMRRKYQRECRRELQPPLPKGNRQMRRILNQAANAAVKAKRYDLRRRLPSDRPAPRTCPIDWRHQPPTSPIDLEDPARARAVRGTGAGRQRRSEEGPRAQDDPRTATSRLSHLPAPSSSPA